MPFQMLEPCKRTTARSTHMRPRFVCLRWWKGCARSEVDICRLGLWMTCNVRDIARGRVTEGCLLLLSIDLEALGSLASTKSLPTVVGVGEAIVADGESEIILRTSRGCQWSLLLDTPVYSECLPNISVTLLLLYSLCLTPRVTSDWKCNGGGAIMMAL